MQAADYTIGEAKYAKGMMAVRCPGKDGWMTRAGRLAQSLARGRYTHREGAYIMSPTRARKFETLYAEGWDGSTITGELQPPCERTAP
jgi:hypothetical protein